MSDGAGDIVAIGDTVTRFAVGDRVTGSYSPDGSTAASMPASSTNSAARWMAC
ncbi:alcohol dehydrogenase catalytic domain-containing protein [Mesorhizobium sp. SEMIA396]|uniref:alcohol dehydrogenase catalytic domain-containing protein n=1 Tax=unclassified Mesorhizobium TaxID=325217 RepID=UPI0035695809